MNTPNRLLTTPSSPQVRLPESRAALVDVYENANELMVVVDLPGATQESTNVHLENGRLTLSAQRVSPSPRDPHAGELTSQTYFRAFAVPTGIDASKVDARLNDGVLHIRLPKPEGVKPRRIDVSQR